MPTGCYVAGQCSGLLWRVVSLWVTDADLRNFSKRTLVTALPRRQSFFLSIFFLFQCIHMSTCVKSKIPRFYGISYDSYSTFWLWKLYRPTGRGEKNWQERLKKREKELVDTRWLFSYTFVFLIFFSLISIFMLHSFELFVSCRYN